MSRYVITGARGVGLLIVLSLVIVYAMSPSSENPSNGVANVDPNDTDQSPEDDTDDTQPSDDTTSDNSNVTDGTNDQGGDDALPDTIHDHSSTTTNVAGASNNNTTSNENSTTNNQITTTPADKPEVNGSPPNGSGLTGMSRQYDDLHCRRIQLRHGVKIPPSATILEVDGYTLPVENLSDIQNSRMPVLYLPRGVHAVRFRPDERAVEVTIEKDFVEEYGQAKGFFAVTSSPKMDDLISRGARTLDYHRAPYLLNFLGAGYAAKQQWESAERKFRRAVRVNPAFSPAHLNYAYCLVRRGQLEVAALEIMLADVFNVGNVFGLAATISQFRIELGLSHETSGVTYDTKRYLPTDQLTAEDQRMVALMRGISKYAVDQIEQAKILNNLGVHFADTGRAEIALEHFRSALETLKFAGPARFKISRQVLKHMSAACQAAGFAEAKEYDQMQYLVVQ